MRMTILSGVAAAVLFVCMLLWNHGGGNAQAADAVRAAAETTSAYKGWVHTVATVEMAKDAKLPSSVSPMPHRVEYHQNTRDGSSAETRQYAKTREVIFRSIATGEESHYRSGSETLEITSIPPENLRAYSNEINPVTLAELLQMLRNEYHREPLSIQETTTGALKRYDVKFFESFKEAEEFSRGKSVQVFGDAISLWVDPKTRLLTRMQFSPAPGVTVTMDVTYGTPDLNDIYDLGVPRKVKIVNHRVPLNLQTILDRLDGRAKRGFGDCVGLLCSYGKDATGKVEQDYGYITLYATQGDKWLINEYRLVSKRPQAGTVLKELPANWPAPDVEKLLPDLKQGLPTRYFVMNGDRGWMGWYSGQANPYPDARTVDPKELNYRLGQQGLAGKLWPSRFKTSIGFEGIKADILQDAAHPGLVGVHYKTTPQPDNGAAGISESTWWIDPTRDDMPVEVTWSYFQKEGGDAQIQSRVRYLEHAQLPNGQWYPTHWQEERSDRDRKTGKMVPSVQHYRLQVWPKLRLDDEWFRRPEPPATSQRSAPAITPAQPATSSAGKLVKWTKTGEYPRTILAIAEADSRARSAKPWAFQDVVPQVFANGRGNYRVAWLKKDPLRDSFWYQWYEFDQTELTIGGRTSIPSELMEPDITQTPDWNVVPATRPTTSAAAHPAATDQHQDPSP